MKSAWGLKKMAAILQTTFLDGIWFDEKFTEV